MSRDGSGNYSLPAGNPVVEDTIVDPDWANDTLSDIGAALTQSLSRNGAGGMSGQFKSADGSVGAPGVSFGSDLDCGLYRIGADSLGMAIGGVRIQEWGATGTTIVASGANIGLTASGDTLGTGAFIYGGSTSGVGLRVGVANAVNACLHVDVSNQPSGPNTIGDMYMTTAGVLKVCTVAGTPGTWVSVGTQV